MKQITVRVGNYNDSQENITFIGELLKTIQEFDSLNDKLQGREYNLYKVRRGYRVFEKRWTNGLGENRENYAKLSDVLKQTELLEKFTFFVNYPEIFEAVKADKEKTILLAANRNNSRLLSYTLENIEQLIELGHFLLDQEEIPDDVKSEFKNVLDEIED